MIGFSGPLTGTAFSVIMDGIYEWTKYSDELMHTGNPLFLGMACVGYFYNLFTLIPFSISRAVGSRPLWRPRRGCSR